MSNKVYSVQCTRSRLQRLTRLGFGSVDSRILNQVIDNKHWQQARSKALHYIFPVVKGQYVFAGAQALRIPFKCLGASEKNPAYREVIMSNNHDVIHHLFGSLEDMLDSSSTCSISIHGGLPCGRDLKVKDIDLGVTGSPCNPYSTKRAKRFGRQSIGDGRWQTNMLALQSYNMAPGCADAPPGGQCQCGAHVCAEVGCGKPHSLLAHKVS